MKRLFICVSIALSVAALASMRIYSSPAATEGWVRSYVATNTTGSAAVSNSVALVTKNEADGMTAVLYILETDKSTNAVQRAADALVSSITPIVNALSADSVKFAK